MTTTAQEAFEAFDDMTESMNKIAEAIVAQSKVLADRSAKLSNLAADADIAERLSYASAASADAVQCVDANAGGQDAINAAIAAIEVTVAKATVEMNHLSDEAASTERKIEECESGWSYARSMLWW
jgi:hypothetical protein